MSELVRERSDETLVFDEELLLESNDGHERMDGVSEENNNSTLALSKTISPIISLRADTIVQNVPKSD